MTPKDHPLDQSGRKTQVLRKLFLLAVILLIVAIVSTHRANAGADSRTPYAIGLWGDLPYNSTQATVGVPNLIADMNSQKLALPPTTAI
jgi:hypothetical protein